MLILSGAVFAVLYAEKFHFGCSMAVFAAYTRLFPKRGQSSYGVSVVLLALFEIETVSFVDSGVDVAPLPVKGFVSGSVLMVESVDVAESTIIGSGRVTWTVRVTTVVFPSVSVTEYPTVWSPAAAVSIVTVSISTSSTVK